MVNKSLLLLAALVAVALAAPAEEPNPAKPQDNGSLIEDGVEKVYRFLQECGDKDMFFCMKMRALTFVDRAVRKAGDIPLADGVALVQSGEAARELSGRALSEDELDNSLPQDAAERDSQVETLLVDRVARFLESRTLQLKVPDSAISDIRRSLDESRGKKKKLKMLLPLLLLLKLKAAALIPLALGALALLAFKALIVGKLALVLSGIIALKKLLSQQKHTQSYEVVAHPHYSHSHSSYGGGDEHGGHYARSLKVEQPAQDLAYSAYKKE
ncbi:hypothetical protein FOCC_FOCC017482 [Frankliniella occidentalis]|uniref:Uncharacterized protein LOC113209210 n=1 Tax=Frankliniella occidentalis TaxID=133901 RepID=A0A6J1SM81_FRAOC|nr:uncharacterized protein LOC113209210 [Frankliniella occidentalis]KAE8737061.1 hypothetical protein FOCC_FOCC017482 [Frankliniella occidentalis]